MTQWHECQPGDETISEDGVSLTCTRVFTYPTKKLLEFTDGNLTLSVWYPRKTFRWEDLPRKRDWMEDEARRRRTRDTVSAYCVYILHGKPPDYSALGEIYGRAGKRIPAMAVRILLRQPRIRRMIREELSKVLLDAGISPEAAAKGIKAAIDLAESKGDPANMLRGWETIVKMLGIDKPQLPPSNGMELPDPGDAYFSEMELPAPPPELPPAGTVDA